MDPSLELADERTSRLDEVIASVLLRMDQGDGCDLAAVVRSYPDLDDEIREFFGDVEFTARAVSLLKQADSVGSDTCILARDTTETAAPFLIPGYEIEGTVAQGGMGVVYRAVQKSLGRRVALKVLFPSLLSNPQRLQRFKEEAQLAASLHHSHVLVIHDILDVDGSPVVVMPLIEGCDLRALIAARQREPAEGEHPVCTEWRALTPEKYLKRMLVLLDKVIEAAAGLHRAGVLHRDIKPSNILIDTSGNPWLADFGLAQLLNIDVSEGEAMGTLGYMSPEQSGGEKIDERADIFSLGVSIYEALTLRRPYGKQTISKHHSPARPPSQVQRKLSRDFDRIIQKAIDPICEKRYKSVEDFRTDWSRVRQGLLPAAGTVGWMESLIRRIRRHLTIIATALLAVVVAFVTWWISAPADTRATVVLMTKPACAQAAFARLDDITGEPTEPAQISTRASVNGEFKFKGLVPGDYLVVAATADGRFHEVYRHVPEGGDVPGLYRHQRWIVRRDNSIELPLIQLVDVESRKMRRYDDANGFRMGSDTFEPPAAPIYETNVQEFLLDICEVTVGEYCKQIPEARSRLSDKLPDGDAMANVSYDEAIAYLELVGKRPVSEAEYELAATCGGTTAYPWGDDGTVIRGWPYGLVKSCRFDRTPTEPIVYGLYSNVAEWTSSRAPTPPLLQLTARSPDFFKQLSKGQVVRGGSYSVALGAAQDAELNLGPRFRHVVNRAFTLPGLGFRGARSVRPHFLTLTIAAARQNAIAEER